MKLYIIAGEASGDLHGANLIKALRQKQPKIDLRCWGGDLMKSEGGTVVKHYKDLAFMGFVEVVLNLKTILGNLSFCKKDILEFQPDAIVLIDYPGFNLRIAKWAKQQKIKVLYYVSPQIWAWNSSRVHQIKKDIDRMFCILPFEKDFYKKYDYEADFVGHPLLDEIKKFQKSSSDFVKENNLADKPIIAILPGSRTQEIKTALPIMLQVALQFPDYQFVVAGAPSQKKTFYNEVFRKEGVELPLIENNTYNLLNNSCAALVTSGTATLETALFEVPEVVCYKGSTISYQIAKRLVNVNYISLVNLIFDKEVVPELIQADFTVKKVSEYLNKILYEGAGERMKNDFKELKKMLGSSGASEKVAKLIFEELTLIHLERGEGRIEN